MTVAGIDSRGNRVGRRALNGGLTTARPANLASDERLAIALHDLDAAMHYNRCSFARTWGTTKFGERYEDNPFGCVGMNRTSKDRRRHFEDWLARAPRVRAVVAELLASREVTDGG